MLLLGPLSRGAKEKHLFVVTRVLDKRRVEAIAHVGYGTATITVSTNAVNRPEGEFKKVSYRPEVATTSEFAGSLVYGG